MLLFFFFLIEGKNFHQQKDYNLLYCYTGFVEVVYNIAKYYLVLDIMKFILNWIGAS